MTVGERSAGRAAARRARGASPGRRGRTMRRRMIGVLGAAALGVAAATVAWPTVDRAMREVTLPLRHDDIIRQQAQAKQLDPTLIAAVIYAESRFRDQTSPTGAKGLMQIQPETAKFIARRSGGTLFQLEHLGSPQTNISYGSYYLRYLLDRYDGNQTLAVAAYNGGETNVDRWIAESGKSRHDFRVDQIPFAETRAYVGRVMEAKQDYRDKYGSELGV